MSGELPLLFEAFEIAKLIGWERRRALGLLKELGIAQKLGDRWCVDRGDLREKFPAAYAELCRRWEAGERPPEQRVKRRRRRHKRARATGTTKAAPEGEYDHPAPVT